MIQEQGSTVYSLLSKLTNLTTLDAMVLGELENLPRINHPDGDVRLSQNSVRLFNLAQKISQQRADQFIATEILLLAMLDEKSAAGKFIAPI